MKKYTELRIGDKKKFWKENPVRGNVDIKIEGIPEFKMFCDNDDSVIKELYWTDFKGWELTSLVLWSNLLSEISNGTIYDIGTYSGIYSLIASNVYKNIRIHAFDIQEKCLKRLEINCGINDFKNIQSHHAACTNFNGETVFYFYEEDEIMSSIAGLVPNKMNNLEKKVKAIKLDDFNKNDEIKLIKIDVEGAEINTLKGLKRVLNENTPDVLVEVNNYKELRSVKKMFPRGYKVYDVNESELTLKKVGWFTKPSKDRNYFFTKKSKRQLSNLFDGNVQ